MSVNSVPFRDLKEAAAAVLRTVDRIGKVETRQGGSETWVESARPNQAFWELTIISAAERGAAAGTYAIETPTVQIDGYMPWSYAQNTEGFWDDLLDAVRNTLRAYPTLGNAVLGVRGPGLPQLTINRIGPYSDEKRTVPVHHARILLPIEIYFSYATSSTLP